MTKTYKPIGLGAPLGSKVLCKKKYNVSAEDCNIALVGTHTKYSKSPDIKTVFGLFPTSQAAAIYQKLLEQSFENTITFTITSTGAL